MRIRNLHIKRYRSLFDFEMQDIGNIAVLIGENSCGKTNLLEALHLFFTQLKLTEQSKTKLEEDHWFDMQTQQPIEFQIEVVLDDSEMRELFPKMTDDFIRRPLNSIEIYRKISGDRIWTTHSLSIGGLEVMSDNSVQIDILDVLERARVYYRPPKVISAKANASSASDTLWGATDEGRVFELDLALKDSIPESAVTSGDLIANYCKENDLVLQKGTWLQHLVGYNSIEGILNKLNTIITAGLRVLEPVETTEISYDRKGYVNPDYVASAVQHYESSSFREQDLWRDFCDEFEKGIEGELEPVKQEMFIEVRRRRFQLKLFGGGYQAWYQMVWQLISETGVFIMEEPESHLHPQLARHLFSFLGNSKTNAQLFLTTHSTVFLDQCDFEEIWHVQIIDGRTTAKRVESIENLREITKILGVRPSDFLMSNNILFVEGPEDKIVFSRTAELMGLKFAPQRVSIIPMGGISKGRFHLGAWAEAAASTGIPFMMLLDGDEDARKEAVKLKKKQKDKKKLIDASSVVNLQKEDLEDYYPSAMLEEFLISTYSIKEENAQKVKAAIESDKRVDAIQKALWKSNGIEEETWKMKAAENFAKTATIEDVDEEIKTILHRIDDYFEGIWNHEIGE